MKGDEKNNVPGEKPGIVGIGDTMAYDEKQKERTMKYLATLKEIRFRVKPEEYKKYEEAAKKGDFKSLRQFYMAAINEKADKILLSGSNQDS